MKVLKKNKDVLVTLEDNGLVKKTVLIPRHSGFRKLSAEEVVEREIRALQKLKNVPYIQRFISRESDTTFYSEYIPASSLHPKIKVDYDYFDKLARLVKQCQQGGVYRIGMNRRDFLVLDGQQPVIIDFGNVLFKDDLMSKLLIPAAKVYSHLRLKDLQRRYSTNGYLKMADTLSYTRNS